MQALLADIGSTFTKLTLVDLEREEIAATAQAATTVEDINIGLGAAIRLLEGRGPAERRNSQRAALEPSRVVYRLACSSAAGGLRMVGIGLVPELTVEAARRAALGAGAKVVGTFAHQLTEADLDTLERLRPDILLLAGGTDGGNERAIVHNAQAIAASSVLVPVVVAGNRVVAGQIASTLRVSGREVWVTENVMPEVDVLNVRPAQETIRQVFLDRIVIAKGFDKAQRSFSGILMPTPSAVLKAAELLAVGTADEAGWGDLIVVDVGGATTDVHSIGQGLPSRPGVLLKGLPEPFAKRTVEGDMGIRYNAPTIFEVAGERRLHKAIGQNVPALEATIGRLSAQVDALPGSSLESRIDVGLARTAVEIAVDRHAGTLKVVYTPFGETFVQHGKDLTVIGRLVGTGGIFAHSGAAREVLEGALFDPNNPTSLRPQQPELWIDWQYVMATLGLLAEKEPTIALRVLKKALAPVQTPLHPGPASSTMAGAERP